MTRTANAIAWDYFQQEEPRDNVVEFSAYRNTQPMESRHYVLVPVQQPAEVASTYTPRPRRNHHNAAANLIHTTLNLAVIGATILFTSALAGMV